MKKIFYMVVAMIATVGLLNSCMDSGYDDVTNLTAQEVYGNNDLVEHNVVSIAELKKMYKALNNSRDTATVKDDVMLKLRVTGNDVGGNIYSYFSAIDENGDAILVYIYAGGLYAYLPVGQEVLIDLKGLCVGSNGTQPCIGGVYKTSSGNVYPKNLNNFIWQKHFKLLGCDASKVQPKEYTASAFASEWNKNKEALAGQLITLKGVTIQGADGKARWGTKADVATEGDFTVKRYITGISSDIYLNTSTSAKFAAEAMPAGKVDVTAVVVRYNNYAQLTLRTADDAHAAN